MLGDLGFVSALKTQMRWHASRQSVLSENIANADTPGYGARDLKRVDHERRFVVETPSVAEPSRTNAMHIKGSIVATRPAVDGEEVSSFEVTPAGNSVVLEEEVMKMTSNQLDYQTVATVYQKSLAMLRTAVGRR